MSTLLKGEAKKLMPDDLAKRFREQGYQGNKSIDEITIIAHYFVGGCDWWMYEYTETREIFYGFVCLGDPQMAELGHVSLKEFVEYNKDPKHLFKVELDLYWKDMPLKEKMNEVKRQ